MNQPGTPNATVLVVDDDAALRRVLARALAADGYEVRTAADGDEAVLALDQPPFDLVVSDIDMPGRSGIELLRTIRARDLDVPVVLITGAPRLETAMSAVEYGASHYLTKPVDLDALRSTVRRAAHAGKLARARRALVALAGDQAMQIGDLAGVEARFDRALDGAFMVFQPIIRWSDRSTFAYEALVRSAEPTMSHPGALFDAAERLGRTLDVGRRIRPMCGQPMNGQGDALLFVNLHPSDLTDDALYDPGAPLAKAATRVVLEITERARLETVPDVHGRIARLRSIGFQIAIDDLGAGYAGLTSFAAIEPEFMKLDRMLVQGVGASTTKTRLVGAMIRVCADLGVHVIGEGVETEEERDALVDLGCDLLQGFLFARPDRPFPTPRF